MSDTKTYDFQAGEVLLIDKPLEWTSFDVVKKIRGQLRIKKIGHAGTLDPLATGLLILCTGKMTKQINNYQGMPKEYTGEFHLGCTTPSYDLETAIENEVDISHLTEEAVYEAVNLFLGEIQQIPPAHSAVKVDGKRAYKSAREGKAVKIDPRTVTIYEFDITSIQFPKVTFRVKCSKGTYIRTLANDFGKALGVGAHLSALRRTAIGDFRVDEAKSIEEMVDIIQAWKRTQQA
ncbi:MAG: tRNA pseudouridine(55) synthase TruB [Flammeovirgaceae bacterium]